VLHATRNLDVTLANVRSLLAPGGTLLAYEGTHHPRWFDTTTGLIEGWQLFEDDCRDDVPLIPPSRWSEALQAADFSDVATFPAQDAPTADLLHNVLVARAAGVETVSTARRSAGVDDHGSDEAAASGVATPADLDVRAALAEAMPDERHDVVVDAVRRAIAHVLRIADPTRLRRDQPLLDLGFDSLMAVELRNVLKQWLELEQKLPATLVFDHPTIDAIAVYLEPMLDDGVAAEQVGTGGTSADTIGSGGARVPLDEAALAGLTDEEVEATLRRKLAEIEK